MKIKNKGVIAGCASTAFLFGEIANANVITVSNSRGRRLVLGAAAAFAALGALTSPSRAGITYTDLYSLVTPTGFQGTVFPFSAAGGQVAGQGNTTAGNANALVYSAPSGTAANLNPTGFTTSTASATSGTQQVGHGSGTATGNNGHALRWTGTAASAVDLNPTGVTYSSAEGTSGTQQVGEGTGTATGNTYHALLWTGTAASVVDLNPTGFTSSFALGTSGTKQVGYGSSATSTNGYTDALLWSGTAASAVDLTPTGFLSSQALAAGGTEQVGFGLSGAMGGSFRALLWTGTAASAIDLTPTGYTGASAEGTNGAQQVGYGDIGGGSRDAMLWNGTAASYVDLGSVLPSTFVSSNAYSIVGTTVYGIAQNTTTGTYDAISWNVSSVVPEPASLSALAMAALAMRRGRRSK